MRFFSTTRPVNCQIHYCVPPLQRFDLDMVLTLIAVLRLDHGLHGLWGAGQRDHLL
jgi:hypothetical protein